MFVLQFNRRIFTRKCWINFNLIFPVKYRISDFCFEIIGHVTKRFVLIGQSEKRARFFFCYEQGFAHSQIDSDWSKFNITELFTFLKNSDRISIFEKTKNSWKHNCHSSIYLLTTLIWQNFSQFRDFRNSVNKSN